MPFCPCFYSHTTWSELGLETYNKYKTKIKKMYKDDLHLQAEQDCLDRLRTALGYNCDSKEDEKKKKAANKRHLKANQPEIEHFKKRKFVSTMSDDEEDDRVVKL